MTSSHEWFPIPPSLPAEGQSEIASPLASDRVNIRGEHSGLVEAAVPIDLVYAQDVPVIHGHVSYLEEEMKAWAATEGGGTGQRRAIWLAEVPDFPQFLIIDGFHRFRALSQAEAPTVLADIQPGCTWETVYSERIKEAQRHSPVQFSRIVEWTAEAWEQTTWSQEKGITAMQAFSMGFNERISGANIGLNVSEAQQIREWVHGHCKEWKLKPGSIYAHLAVARLAAPDLVKEVRAAKSSRGSEDITPQHLKAIAYIFPGRENYDMQRRVADAVRVHHLTTPQTQALATALSDVTSDHQRNYLTGPGIYKIIDNAPASKSKPQSSASSATAPASAHGVQFPEQTDWDILNNASFRSKLLDRELRIGAQSVELLVLRGMYSLSTTFELLRNTVSNARPEVMPYVQDMMHRYEDKLRVGPALRYRPASFGKDDRDAAYALTTRVRHILPLMDSEESQAVVLSVFYRLPLSVMASILNMEKSSVAELVKRTTQDLAVPDVQKLVTPEQDDA